MHTNKRLLAILLTVVTVLTLLPASLSVSAEETA